MKALMPGSFDPITKGHVALVRRACAQYDEVVVAVMINAQKQYRFTMEERTEMARRALADLQQVRVIASEGLLVDLFDRVGADVIVKGVRNEVDRRYEAEMAAWNLAHNPRAHTVFLAADAAYADVSSTAVRRALDAGTGADDLLPPAVSAYLREKRNGTSSRT